MRREATVLCVVLFVLGGCRSGRPALLTMRGSTPCPPESGAVETWCDDAGNCEFRVTTGGVFSCRSVGSEECLAAAMEATEACRAGGLGDGGVIGDGSVGNDATVSDPCASLCTGCPSLCSDCRAEQAQSPSCSGTLASAYACVRLDACDGEACTAELQQHVACTCGSTASRLQNEAALCGQSFDADCTTPDGALAVRVCESQFDASGCAAFSSPSCSRCLGGTSCGGVCTSLRDDPNHCGACGNVCRAGSTCNDGTCAATTCSVAGAPDVFAPLPPACMPRCSSATLSAYSACTTEACVESALSSDTTPPINLDRGGGANTSLDCHGCFNWQLNSCAEDTCPSQFATYASCAAAGDPSTITSRCASQISAVNECLMTHTDEYGACVNSRVGMCF